MRTAKQLANLRRHVPGETHPPTHTQKHPNGYLTPLLKKLLLKKINYEDPETRKIVNGKVKDVILLRLILNASEGDNVAIKEILDRVDGKVKERVEHSGAINLSQTDKAAILENIKNAIQNGLL